MVAKNASVSLTSVWVICEIITYPSLWPVKPGGHYSQHVWQAPSYRHPNYRESPSRFLRRLHSGKHSVRVPSRAPSKLFVGACLPHMGCMYSIRCAPFNIDCVCFTAHTCRHYANLPFVYASCAPPPTGLYHPIGERMPLVCTMFAMPVNMYAVCVAPI